MKSLLGNFYKHLTIFLGHTVCNANFNCQAFSNLQLVWMSLKLTVKSMAIHSYLDKSQTNQMCAWKLSMVSIVMEVTLWHQSATNATKLENSWGSYLERLNMNVILCLKVLSNQIIILVDTNIHFTEPFCAANDKNKWTLCNLLSLYFFFNTINPIIYNVQLSYFVTINES